MEHTALTVFCLFSWLFFFFLHTHLLVPAKRQTTEFREDLEPGRDGPALFLGLQFFTPRREQRQQMGNSAFLPYSSLHLTHPVGTRITPAMAL